jgi:hypothetical protein
MIILDIIFFIVFYLGLAYKNTRKRIASRREKEQRQRKQEEFKKQDRALKTKTKTRKVTRLVQNAIVSGMVAKTQAQGEA